MRAHFPTGFVLIERIPLRSCNRQKTPISDRRYIHGKFISKGQIPGRFHPRHEAGYRQEGGLSNRHNGR